jgi:hypothetical protein
MDENQPGSRLVAGVMVNYRPRVTARLILGLVVITLGVLWTLDNMGVVESEPVLRWWPVILVSFGVAKLLGVGTCRNTFGGSILTLVGVLLLGESLGLEWLDFSMMWPLVLVAVGVQLLMRSMRSSQGPATPTGDPSATLSTFALWSGVDRKALSGEFRGGDVTAMMGGAQIDLRQAKPVPEGAVLDLFVWMGGVDVKVPENWKVVNQVTVLMGGIEDKSKTPSPDSRDILFLRGLVLMGGVDIKN